MKWYLKWKTVVLAHRRSIIWQPDEHLCVVLQFETFKMNFSRNGQEEKVALSEWPVRSPDLTL